ncbi:hypothetical protein [Litchfieldia alkalitelluris]|uniref:hypothetical protein n=1 Tax=Litchfieldia alkalitelluris TaxID=304268 RepID=UPI000996D7A0|nr:hypothetical protein [Litchfieldia alkalitelluris]
MKQFHFIFETDKKTIKELRFNSNGMFEAMKKAKIIKKELETTNPNQTIKVKFLGVAYGNIA